MTAEEKIEFDKLTEIEKVYYKYKILVREAKIDTALDKSKLEVAFNVTMSLNKWITTKIEWTRVFRVYENKRKEAWCKRYEFYQTGFNLKLTTKDEYTMFIESDSAYVDHMNLALSVKEALMFIDGVIDTLKSKQWEIKAYMEYLKFINGR